MLRPGLALLLAASVSLTAPAWAAPTPNTPGKPIVTAGQAAQAAAKKALEPGEVAEEEIPPFTGGPITSVYARPAGWNGSPIAVAGASFLVPGLGQLLLGDGGGAAIAFGTAAVPLTLGLLNAPPIIFADLPESRSSFWLLTAQEALCLGSYKAYTTARRLTNNEGYHTPLRDPNVVDLILAPAKPSNLLDWQPWAVVALNLASGILIELVLPDPPSPDTPIVFDARSATLFNRQVSPAVGYGAHLAGSTLLSAHAGIGEEALFRGVLQEEAERYLGPTGGLLVASSLFGLIHVGGINQTSYLKQFLATGMGGLILGGYYQLSGYDLEKPIAAHTYYDIIAFGLGGLYPQTKGNNVFGIQYRF